MLSPASQAASTKCHGQPEKTAKIAMPPPAGIPHTPRGFSAIR